ncbi:MAG: hypothetical protein ACR2N2_02750 [Acidimicrobiia bacterium]
MSTRQLTRHHLEPDTDPVDGRFVRRLALGVALAYSTSLAVMYFVAPELLTDLSVQVVWILTTMFAVATYMVRRMLNSAPLNPNHEYHRTPSRRMQKWMTSNHV